jgi:hypothetical protein
MTFLGLIFLCVLALGDETHYFHHEGTMAVNHEEGKTFGVIIVEILPAINMTHIAGMFVKDKVHTPFEISSKFSSIQKNPDGSFVINVTSFEGKYGKKAVKKLNGSGILAGTWNQLEFIGIYRSEVDHLLFEFKAVGKKHACQYYTMEEAAVRASHLLDEPYTAYKGNQLLNHAVFGYAYLATTCLDYLKNVGTPIQQAKPGAVIIANDGSYCAIVDREGSKFIHSYPSKRKVIWTPLVLIDHYFRTGYTMKEYKCATANY